MGNKNVLVKKNLSNKSLKTYENKKCAEAGKVKLKRLSDLVSPVHRNKMAKEERTVKHTPIVYDLDEATCSKKEDIKLPTEICQGCMCKEDLIRMTECFKHHADKITYAMAMQECFQLKMNGALCHNCGGLVKLCYEFKKMVDYSQTIILISKRNIDQRETTMLDDTTTDDKYADIRNDVPLVTSENCMAIANNPVDKIPDMRALVFKTLASIKHIANKAAHRNLHTTKRVKNKLITKPEGDENEDFSARENVFAPSYELVLERLTDADELNIGPLVDPLDSVAANDPVLERSGDSMIDTVRYCKLPSDSPSRFFEQKIEKEEENSIDDSLSPDESSPENSDSYTDPKEYKKTCHFCPLKFKTNYLVGAHHRDVHNLFKQCKKCLLEFENKAKYLDHIKNLCYKDSPYSCRICFERYMDLSERNKHMLETHSHLHVNCSYCPQVLWKKALPRHIRETHTSVYESKCDICNKLFTKKNLPKHYKFVHTDEKQYKCEICGKALKTKWSLQVHKKIHNDVKDFICTICGEEFTYKCSLQSHMKKKHEINESL